MIPPPHRGSSKLLAISRREYVSPALMAMAYAGMDDRAGAFECFERSYDERSNLMLYFAVHPFLDPLRDDPRYKRLAARIARLHAVRETF